MSVDVIENPFVVVDVDEVSGNSSSGNSSYLPIVKNDKQSSIVNVIEQDSKEKSIEEKNKQIAIDNITHAIYNNQRILDEFTRLVIETDDPRAYEICSKMMVNAALLSEKLTNVTYAGYKNANTDSSSNGASSTPQQVNNTQNNIYMNPADLIKHLKGE